MKKTLCMLLTAICLGSALTATARDQKIIAITTDNTQWVMGVDGNGTLRTLHFGKKMGDVSAFAAYDRHAGEGYGGEQFYGNGAMAYPTQGGQYFMEPALSVVYADGSRNVELRYTGHSSRSNGDVETTDISLKDPVSGLEVKLIYDAYLHEDVISSHSEITNPGKKPVTLEQYASSSLYVDADIYLLTHFAGTWAEEMQAESRLLGRDITVLESKRGTQVTQAANPSFVLSLGTEELDERHGEVIAGALAWSGNFRISFEMDEGGRVNILSGISPYSAHYPLGGGKTFITPEMLYTFSAEGVGQASRNFHRWARRYGVYGGGAVNPTLLNSWEGAYFNISTGVLLGMIDDAAAMGLEMFVLDDGWFGKDYPRNSDNAGLGDWELNPAKIPEGIDYVASYAHKKGIKFGIWIEPEMVNPSSRLAHEHPEWVVQSPGRDIPQIRNQWVLDLSNPAVQDFVYGVFDRTMQLSSNIDYIKWDCNRVVTSMGSKYLGKEQDRFFVEYAQGFYNIMKRIRAKYPEVLVQCCSSGGGRVDYGQLRYFNEVWTSDNTDAISRTYIQYATSLLYPACIMGSHVSAVPNHQTGNTTSLKFRFDVASSGRLGMELQPKALSENERAFAMQAIESYKQYRDLVFEGDLYRLSSPFESDGYSLMYVSEDKSRAVVFSYVLKFRNREKGGQTLRLDGLDPSRSYKVTEMNVRRSCWWGSGNSFRGDFLMGGGFNPRITRAGGSAVFYLEAE